MICSLPPTPMKKRLLLLINSYSIEDGVFNEDVAINYIIPREGLDGVEITKKLLDSYYGTCPHCCLFLETLSDVITHERNCEKTGVACDTCYEIFPREDTFELHRKIGCCRPRYSHDLPFANIKSGLTRWTVSDLK